MHKQNINTIIGSFEVSVSCGSTDPANLATSGSYPTVVHNGGFQLLDLIITELKSHMTC